jgi:hypothetical protein
MRRLAAFGMVLISWFAHAQTWQWPVEPSMVLSSFGQTENEAYSRGVVFASTGGPVYPAAAGRVILVRDTATTARSVLGTTVVVEHPRGFRTVYGNLEPGSTPEPGEPVTASTSIGVAGRSGRTTGVALYFAVLDARAGVWVNPCLLLPETRDDTAPTIRSVLLSRGGDLIELTDGLTVPSGPYDVVIHATDRWSRSGVHVAPYSVRLFVDGREQMSVEHDRIEFVEGTARLVPGPAASHDQVRTGAGEYLARDIRVASGRNLVELTVRDLEGNDASIVWEVIGTQ